MFRFRIQTNKNLIYLSKKKQIIRMNVIREKKGRRYKETEKQSNET